jgi:hypothetical protein
MATTAPQGFMGCLKKWRARRTRTCGPEIRRRVDGRSRRLCHREIDGDSEDRFETDRRVLPLFDGIDRGPRERVVRRSQNGDVADRAVGVNDRVEHDLSWYPRRLQGARIHRLDFLEERDVAARSETHRSGTGLTRPDNARGSGRLSRIRLIVRRRVLRDFGFQRRFLRLGSGRRPGSVGDANYSPLVSVDGIIHDAPVVAAAVEDAHINFPSGNPNYALVHDQVVAIDPVNRTVTLSLINGYSFGKPVLYISTEASDPTVAAIEGNTFAPRMHRLEVGIDDIARSAVERIFIATNCASEGGCNNPQRQGLSAALLDGHRPNNTFGGIPSIATDYSPVWDANLYEWTEDAIEKGYRGLLTEEFRILKLARDGYITGPNGAPFGSAGPVIVCGVAARLN